MANDSKIKLSEAAFAEANALKEQGLLEAAVGKYQEALQHFSGHYKAANNLGTTLHSLRRFEEAIQAQELALQTKPDHASAHYNLGNIYKTLSQFEQAIQCYLKALKHMPELIEAYANLGTCYYYLGMLEQAEVSLQEALIRAPQLAEAKGNLGKVLLARGDVEQGISLLGQAHALAPKHQNVSDAWLFASLYSPTLSTEELFARHILESETTAAAVAKRAINKVSRIGLVSADFREHSVAYFVQALLKLGELGQIEVCCYSDCLQEDSMSRELKTLSSHWLSTGTWSNERLIDQVQADQIDILFDLGGHTDNNRLEVFKEKPAPVQISYIGYPFSTGIASIDYKLVDEVTDPTGSEHYYREELLRLPRCFLCYTPPSEDIALEMIDESEGVVFGSFHNLSKVNDVVIELWARILQALPSSKLLLKGLSTGDKKSQEFILQALKCYEIEKDRIIFEKHYSSRSDHLRCYDRVDMALDTFPYNGTTTTCEALWMGVPVLTLLGESHRARVGASLLKAAGLDHMIAETPDEYLEQACAASKRKVEQREELRQQLLNSTLCDTEDYLAALTKLLSDL